MSRPSSLVGGGGGGAGCSSCLIERVLPDCPCYVLRPRHQRADNQDDRGGASPHSGTAECRHATCRSCRGAEISALGTATSLQASCLYESKVGHERFASMPPGVVAVEDTASSPPSLPTTDDFAIENFIFVNHLQRVAARGSDLQRYWHLREHCGCRCRCQGCRQVSMTRPASYRERDDNDNERDTSRRPRRATSASLPLRHRPRDEDSNSDRGVDDDDAGRGGRQRAWRRRDNAPEQETPPAPPPTKGSVWLPVAASLAMPTASLSDHLAARSRDKRSVISFDTNGKGESLLTVPVTEISHDRTSALAPVVSASAPAGAVPEAGATGASAASPLSLAARVQATMHRRRLDPKPTEGPRQLVHLETRDDRTRETRNLDDDHDDSLVAVHRPSDSGNAAAAFFPFVEDTTPRVLSFSVASAVSPSPPAAAFFAPENVVGSAVQTSTVPAPTSAAVPLSASATVFCDYKLRLAPAVLAKHPGAVVLCPACCLVLDADTRLVSQHIKKAHLVRSEGVQPSFAVSWYPLHTEVDGATATTTGQPSEALRGSSGQRQRASTEGPLWQLVADDTARQLPSYVTVSSCVTDADRAEVSAGPVSHRQFLDFFDVVTLSCRDCKACGDNSEKLPLTHVWQHANTPAHARNARQCASGAVAANLSL